MNKKTLPLLILAAGAVLRVAGLVASPVWYDESYSLYLARVPTQMVHLEFTDFNPPLWQLLVSPSIWLFGQNELGVRLPALLCSLAALWLAWRIAGRLVFPRWVDRSIIMPAVAVLLAWLPYGFWMAQDGRAYSMMSLIYLGVIWMILERRWMGYGALQGLLLYSHLTGMFYAAAAGVAALLLFPRDWKKILLWSGIAGLSFAPWLPTLFINGRADHWVGDLTSTRLINGLYAVFFAGDIQGAWGAFARLLIPVSLGIGLFVALVRWKERDHLALTLFAVGPLLLMLAAALVRNVIFYRPLSAMLAPLALWLPASLLPTERRGWRVGWLLPAAWGLVVAAGLLAWTPSLKGGELRTEAAMINREWQPGDVVYHATATSYLPFSIYLKEPGYLLDEDQHAGLLQTPIQQAFRLPRQALESIPHQRVWVIWAKDRLISPQAQQRMQIYTQGARLVGTVHYWQAAWIDIYLLDPGESYAQR